MLTLVDPTWKMHTRSTEYTNEVGIYEHEDVLLADKNKARVIIEEGPVPNYGFYTLYQGGVGSTD